MSALPLARSGRDPAFRMARGRTGGSAGAAAPLLLLAALPTALTVGAFIVVVAAAAAGGCRSREPASTSVAPSAGGSIVKTSASGPVAATVTLAPEKPTLGDALHLTLKVTAERDVELRLPAFGEALGRFAITSFTPRRSARPDGASEESQEYVLEAPMSGRQKIPPLLIEFVDRRGTAGAAGSVATDAGAAGVAPSELLTEEIALDVASVLDDDSGGQLRGPLGALPESEGTGARRRWPWYGAGAGALALAVAAALFLRHRRRRKEAALDPLDVALDRLAALESGGLPAPEAADGWYVEISAIIRRFLEERFALRAPELTTEEFLARAGDSSLLAPGHRVLLRSFLERCDRVKFAAWRPPESESREVIAAARRFLEESRPAPAPGPKDSASARLGGGDAARP